MARLMELALTSTAVSVPIDPLAPAANRARFTDKTKVEVYQVPSGAFIIKAGKKMFATETQTWESFAKMDSEPPEGMGTGP